MTGGTPTGRAGDWLEVRAPDGSPPRRGLILEILGRPGHEHYRARWLDGHESIFVPADGTSVIRNDAAAAAST